MNKSITFKLSVPPSANMAYVNVPGKGRVASDKLRRWRTAAGWELMLQKPKGDAIQTPVEIAIYLQREGTRRRADADNRIKPLLDLLKTHGIIPDDSADFVRSVSVEWVPPGTGPACLLEIRTV